MGRKVFRQLVDQEQARTILAENLPPYDYQSEAVPLYQGLGRVLAKDVVAPIDVPPFDRASMDGFAVIAKDTLGAAEDMQITLRVIGDIQAGYVFDGIIGPGECIEISTGAPMPSGANAVVMVEYCQRKGDQVGISRAVTPRENTMAAGADIQAGERVVPMHRLLSSRDLAVISAVGLNQVDVVRKPRIAVFSSGDEIVPPGSILKPGKLYDINSTSIITSILENGGNPKFCGIVKDNRSVIENQLQSVLSDFDMVIISGGTSAGMGDMLYEVIDELGAPGLLVHGVKVKPGKPTILAVCDGTPVIGLPGYPASALSILQLFVLPLVRKMAALPPQAVSSIVKARINQRLRSAEGRYESKPVYLFQGVEGLIAFPVSGGSGAITSVALADGFLRIPENTHFIAAGSEVEVHLISEYIRPPSLQIIGNYDPALIRLQQLFEQTYPELSIRIVAAGSSGSLAAIRRGEAHIAGVNLLDPARGYNTWLGDEGTMTVIDGYYRMQGFIVPTGNPKEIYSVKDLLRNDVKLLNRNPGSGTRILLDLFLSKMNADTSKIQGYNRSVRSHSSAAHAVLSGEADVSLGIEEVTRGVDLDFIPLREEEYDFVIPNEFLELDAVQKFTSLLHSAAFQELLASLSGYKAKNL